MHPLSQERCLEMGYDPGELLDFRNFVFLVWDHLADVDKDPTPIQEDVAQTIQANDGNLIILGFRGMAKSYLTSAYVLWSLFLDPFLNILVYSCNQRRAQHFSIFCKRLIQEMDLLEHLRPRPGSRWSGEGFDVGPCGAGNHTPSVMSMGIGSSSVGYRADIIVGDDIESPQNALTQTEREKLLLFVSDFQNIKKPKSEANPRVLILGTFQTMDSIYLALASQGYRAVIWPGRYPDSSWMEVNGHMLAPTVKGLLDEDPTLVGKPTDPQRFSEEDLMERELTEGRSGFALHFMLDASLQDANRYPLKVADLVVMDLDSEFAPEKVVWGTSDPWRNELPNVGFAGDRFHRPMAFENQRMAPYQGVVMAIDPAGKGADETAYAIVKLLNSQLFVAEVRGMGTAVGYEDDVLKALAERARAHKVQKIIVEENFGGGMFEKLLAPVLRATYPCSVESVKHSQQKELRIIDTLEPVMNQHRVVMGAGVIREDQVLDPNLSPEKRGQYQLLYQLTHLTRERGALLHDDRLDALSMAVRFWVDHMAVGVDHHIFRAQQAEDDAMFKQWERDAEVSRRGTRRKRWAV